MASTLRLSSAPVSRRAVCTRRVAVIANANGEASDRRAALLGLASVAALVSAKPAEAGYGEAANIFGATTSTSGFVSYAGDGFALLLPSRWSPSAEKPFPGSVLRYVDFYPSNSLNVIKLPANKNSVDDYGGPDALLRELQNMGIFGKQAYTETSRSEGGFAAGRYAAASLLDQGVSTDKKGKKYYEYEVLTRTADGTEGGRTNYIKTAVGSDRNLYVLITSIGDKRLAYAKKGASGAIDSFIVA